jgi:hypothetical protein
MIQYPGALRRWNLRGRSSWQQTAWEPHLSPLCGKCERWLNSLVLCGLGQTGQWYFHFTPPWVAPRQTMGVWKLSVQILRQVQTLYNWCCLQDLPLVTSLYLESRDLLSLWRKPFLLFLHGIPGKLTPLSLIRYGLSRDPPLQGRSNHYRLSMYGFHDLHQNLTRPILAHHRTKMRHSTRQIRKNPNISNYASPCSCRSHVRLPGLHDCLYCRVVCQGSTGN